jgi:rare lipoprotein A
VKTDFVLANHQARSFSLVRCGWLAVATLLLFGGCATPPQQIFPTGPKPTDPIYTTVSTQTGIASYYYGRWIGRKTANGEIYRASDVTAAHRTLPFNTMVRVTNQRNGKSVIVRINNRGPYIRGRIIDLSLEAARTIDMTKAGIVPVKVEVLRKVDVMTDPNLRRREGPLVPTTTDAATSATSATSATARANDIPPPSRSTAGRQGRR